MKKDWNVFIKLFNDINPNFNKYLINKCPEITESELRICNLIKMSSSAREIADKMKLPLKVVKDILGEDSINEKFTKKDFDRNEDENEHTKNSYELAKMFGDTSEKSRMTRLYNKTRKVGSFLTKAENDFVTMIQSKYYRRLREELELDEQIKTYNRIYSIRFTKRN